MALPKTRANETKILRRFPGAEISLVNGFQGHKMTIFHWLMKFTQMGKWVFFLLIEIAFGVVTVQLARYDNRHDV